MDPVQSIIESLKEQVKKRDEPVSVIFPFPGFSSLELNTERLKNVDEVKSEDTISFVDGGNGDLIKSPDLVVQFMRVHFSKYKNNVRVDSSTSEFYAVLKSKAKDGSIFYTASLFPLRKGNLSDGFFRDTFSINSMDPSISSGNNRAALSSLGGLIRRVAEIDVATNINTDIVVLDGTLQAMVDKERQYMQRLLSSEKRVCSLAKTTELYTVDGRSVVSALHSMAGDKAWNYVKIAQSANTNIFFTKLHPNSKHIFRFELYHSEEHEKVISILMRNSTDPVFLGYPYGLIDADRFARVSNSESAYLRTVIMAKAGEAWRSVEHSLSSQNAHNILDTIY